MQFTYCGHCGDKLKKLTDTKYTCLTCDSDTYNNPRAAVAVMILDQAKQKLLMATRAEEPNKGKLDYVGGFADYGEDPETAIHREVLEETGLKISILTLLGAYGHMHEPNTSVCVITYLAQIAEGSFKPMDDVASLAWYEISEVPEDRLAFTSYPKMLSDLKTYLSSGLL